MKKILGAVTLTAMCICACAFIITSVQAAEPEPLTVGPEQQYHTLSEAIEHALDGQVIRLVGSVTETNPASPVVIDKRVTIQGDGFSVYRITGWTGQDTPFQITQEGVVIKDLDIDINGGSTAYPLIKTGRNLSLINAKITLAGTSATASAPILVAADGLQMVNVNIKSTARAMAIMDLQGSSADLNGVTISAGAGITGIYSEASPASLILDGCSFFTETKTSTAVSLPSPAGLTLKGCGFAYIGAAAGLGNTGLLFAAPSAAVTTEALTASGCTFDMKAGTGISLNGYGASFADCEFVVDASSGKGVASDTSSDADLTFTGCKLLVGITDSAKISGANCVALKGNTGNITIDKCEISASEPSIGLTTPSAVILNASDSELSSLTITGSSFAFNIGANNTIGVNAKSIGSLAVTGCGFTVDAPSAKCIVAANIGTGRISSCRFDVGTALQTASNVVCVDVADAGVLMIDASSSFNIKSKSSGIVAGVKHLVVNDSTFNVDAASAKGIAVNGVASGSINGCEFVVKNSNAIGIGILDSLQVSLTDNTFDLSTGGRGVNMTTSSGAAAGDALIENSEINIKGDTAMVGFIFEHLNSLSIKHTSLNTPAGTTGSTTCVRANHIKSLELNNFNMDIGSVATSGIVLNDTKLPPDDDAKVTILNTDVSLNENSNRAIRIFYADGALVDKCNAKVGSQSISSCVLFFQNSKNVEVKNCDYEAGAPGAIFLSIKGDSKTSEESRDFAVHDNNLTLKNNAQGIVAVQANHNIDIFKNSIYIYNATKGVVIAYGRSNNVYENQFFADNCEMAIVSDGVDEISSFTPDVDNDIYDASGNIIDEYRNKIHGNRFTGSYGRGIYISNNGDAVIDNDFSNATFNYEPIPGKGSNTQIIVSFSKDIKILDNSFAKTSSPDNQVIKIYNAVISEATGNTTQLAPGATEVLFVQGTTELAPDGKKYPESVTVHDTTNTIDGVPPIEIVNEWNDPDNLIYKYILRISGIVPPTPENPSPPAPERETPGRERERERASGRDEFFVINEEEVPLAPSPEVNPNPQTGKGAASTLLIWGFFSLLTAELLLMTGRGRRQASKSS